MHQAWAAGKTMDLRAFNIPRVHEDGEDRTRILDAKSIGVRRVAYRHDGCITSGDVARDHMVTF